MNVITLPLSPSEAYRRIEELIRLSEYERLSKEELNELRALRQMCDETLNDMSTDW